MPGVRYMMSTSLCGLSGRQSYKALEYPQQLLKWWRRGIRHDLEEASRLKQMSHLEQTKHLQQTSQLENGWHRL